MYQLVPKLYDVFTEIFKPDMLFFYLYHSIECKYFKCYTHFHQIQSDTFVYFAAFIRIYSSEGLITYDDSLHDFLEFLMTGPPAGPQCVTSVTKKVEKKKISHLKYLLLCYDKT